MLYTVITNTKLQTIKDEIEARAKEVGFGVLKVYPFKDILESKGHPIEQDITVFEVCNPPAAQKVLSAHPEMSVYLPCRISLYEENGKSVLSTIGLEDMIAHFEIDEAIKNEIKVAYTKLESILNSWN